MKRRHKGFSLIAMVIALAVIGVLLTSLVISFVRRLDRIAREKEVSALKSLGSAFRDSIRRTRYDPGESGWASAVAAQLGWQVNDVMINDRNITRVFLYDPIMQIGVNSVGGPSLP